MDAIEVNWEQKRPNATQMLDLWAETSFKSIENWTNSAFVLKNKLNETFLNRGVQLHRYQMKSNVHFLWFASRNLLNEIDFLKNSLQHENLSDYRKDLVIHSKPEIKLINYWTDMYHLPGQLARFMSQGGAYRKIDPKEAWELVTKFIKDEFNNRFNEVLLFEFTIKNAHWFFDIAWDYSAMFFDKRNFTVTIIDITDSD